uniref:Variant surface glycoprotein 1125.5080 n=1 Tax=Trypanosoma brucei TaxID=5691 RepID=A0A1J0RBR0_9TRYP|nr:variant surface glycoprotein 1125.5080 [Trypanosoma brucei]
MLTESFVIVAFLTNIRRPTDAAAKNPLVATKIQPLCTAARQARALRPKINTEMEMRINTIETTSTMQVNVAAYAYLSADSRKKKLALVCSTAAAEALAVQLTQVNSNAKTATKEAAATAIVACKITQGIGLVAEIKRDTATRNCVCINKGDSDSTPAALTAYLAGCDTDELPAQDSGIHEVVLASTSTAACKIEGNGFSTQGSENKCKLFGNHASSANILTGGGTIANLEVVSGLIKVGSSGPEFVVTAAITPGATNKGSKQALQQMTDAVHNWEQSAQAAAKAAAEIVFDIETSSEFASRAYIVETGKSPPENDVSAVTSNMAQIKKDLGNTAQAFKSTFLEGLFQKELAVPTTLKIKNKKFKEMYEPDLRKLTNHLQQKLLFSTKV